MPILRNKKVEETRTTAGRIRGKKSYFILHLGDEVGHEVEQFENRIARGTGAQQMRSGSHRGLEIWFEHIWLKIHIFENYKRDVKGPRVTPTRKESVRIDMA